MSTRASPSLGTPVRAVLASLALLVACPCLGQSPSPFQSVPGPAPAPAPAKPATKAHRSPDDSDVYPPPATDTTAAPAPAPTVAQPPTPAPATAPLPAVAPAPPGAVPVATGTISVIREISVWNAFCRALPVSVAVIAQPQHGAIALRDEGVTPVTSSPGNGSITSRKPVFTGPIGWSILCLRGQDPAVRWSSISRSVEQVTQEQYWRSGTFLSPEPCLRTPFAQ